MPPKFDPFKIKARDVEKITGRKLSLFQKIKLRIARTALKKYTDGAMTSRQRKQARISMILGIIGFGLLLVSLSPVLGFLGIFSVPVAILAIVLGSKSLRGNSNSEGIIGVVTGGLTLAIIILAVILFAILFAGFTFE